MFFWAGRAPVLDRKPVPGSVRMRSVSGPVPGPAAWGRLLGPCSFESVLSLTPDPMQADKFGEQDTVLDVGIFGYAENVVWVILRI